MNLPKILIIGETGHGKDELCKLLVEHFGYQFTSASMLACELFVFEALKEKYNYTSVENCHNDRRNHIEEWVDLIAEYNMPDGAALAKEILKVSDIYCGVRKRTEFDAMQQADLFDCIIYIDATKRLGKEEKSFVEVTVDDANFTVDNNADIKQLVQRVKRAHARAMQIAATRELKPVEVETAVSTRDDLVKTSNTEQQQIVETINEEYEKDQPAEECEDENKVEEEVKVEAKEETKEVKPKPKAKPKAKVNRPPKAPTRK